VAVPFVDSTRLLVQRGMVGATGNVYCGLHEFPDMGFVLHVLRPGDLFVDVGANVGSYTVLAAGAAGANCVSFEPVPSSFAHLLDNVRLNNLESKVMAKNIGIGAVSRTITFTAGLDAENHVATAAELATSTIEVPVEPLDAVVQHGPVMVLKIDVEGYETEVLNGAKELMQAEGLLAVIMELNGSGHRYGYDESEIHRRMLAWGFSPAHYDPLTRELSHRVDRSADPGNTLYVRDLELVRERVRSAPPHMVMGMEL
jgi:FkbM family methyltransferase